MADRAIPWLKQFQSKGRGFRPGMEVNVLTSGRNVGKTIIIDYESDTFKPWRETIRDHYAEYHDYDTGETFWMKYPRLPGSSQMCTANNVVRKNEDGTYEYVKNRKTGELRQLSEEEIMWMLLHV